MSLCYLIVVMDLGVHLSRTLCGLICIIILIRQLKDSQLSAFVIGVAS